MTGRKTLAEVRADLEAALGAGPTEVGSVAESLRRFLSGGACIPGKMPQEPASAAKDSDTVRATAIDIEPVGIGPVTPSPAKGR